jgi:Mor family transcriptional regulator
MSKIVLIGDIVASRKIKDRASIQKQLTAAIRQLNRTNSNLLSPYTITLGDEFQAVYAKADHLFSDLVSILLALYPEQVRFSIGIGSIDTPINKQQAIGMDGPAFYLARKGIEQLKASGYLFIVNGLSDEQQDIVNNSLFLVSHHLGKWKQSRLSVFQFLQQGLSVAAMTKKLKLSDKAIYKTIDQGELKIMQQLFLDVEKVINASTTVQKT